MSWKQIYDPIGDSIGLSALVALIPILYLLWALAIKRMKGYIAGLTTLVVALFVAVLVYGMPAGMAAMSILQGAVYGLLPIGWIIVASVFLYKLSVKTGQFDIIRDSIVSITEDRRLQALLIAFSFGAFLEGAAGFGAPVAISAALLVGLGFNPLYAAGLCLLANTAPVAFGAIGSPVIAIEGPTGMSAIEVSKVVGRQLPFLSVFVPFYLVVLMAGFKKAFEVIPAILVSGVSFAVTQFLVSNYLGPELPDIISALVSIIALTLFLKVWQPKTAFRFKSEMGQAEMAAGNAESIHVIKSDGKKTYTLPQILKAWSPFIVLTFIISVWGIPTIKKALIGQYEGTNTLLQGLNSLGSYLSFHPAVPGLNNLIIDGNGQPIAALFKLELLAAAGTAILISAIISKFILKIGWKSWFSTFIETLNELKFALVTIASVVGFAYVANASGMSITLGMTLAATGSLFPFVSPILGWLGVFLTGSDTSANLLFSSLQKITANQVGMDPILAIAANSSGGVTGKMISPQSIAVACAAVGLGGKESDLLRFTIKHSIILLLIICCLTYLQSTVLSWMLP
ncbi:lactate permease [Fictibacillus enclensis]|uniref:L-lactate permease n=1 Tax=Fictibacillus enclensis TaxID=1017270 RepID=A0A0V8JFG5_9BACL|nr:lactate permease LctP family transporter [Fictibacillus enclensis]KSU85408.1 lactate permease [Fictibacillus enclensis]SCB96212.1 lactate permease [Fictibacillus enclensis]